jgi:hypothetical protein
VSAVEAAFHTTQHDDETIAHNITTQGIPTTRNQVKEVRLANSWRRRGNDDTQSANSRSETFALVAQALQQGEARCYGRRLMRTYLSVKFCHNARDDDVRNALTALDPAGVQSRHRKAANILHPDQISYGAVTATTSSAITALRFMQASTLTLDAFSGATLVTAIAGPSTSSSHGAENNGARQQRRRRAVGETRVRGSPRLTSAHLCDTRPR